MKTRPREVPSDPDRAGAEALDAADPLASFRDRFVVPDPDLIYLDGNSLGRLPARTAERLRGLIRDEWGGDLVRGWDHWVGDPTRVGDAIARDIVGARPGEVVVSDSTTVNFYKLAAAALAARPGRRVVVTDRDNFPTNRYVLEGLADARDLEIRWIAADPIEGPQPADVAAALDRDVAVVALSHVNYRSAAIADLAAITAVAHDAGALTIWDLSHSAGSIPVDLDAAGADLAVGCTYKYLNGGPGSPAFLYVRTALQAELRNPIQGWFGREEQFAMAQGWTARAGIGAWLTGTPTILALAAVEEGVGVVAEAGISAIRDKGIALTRAAIALHDAWLAPLGFTLGSPRDDARRGAHVAVRRGDARHLCAALIQAGVVTDFREPDSIRLGLSPLTTSFADVRTAIERLRDLASGGG
ncbi:MAG TPA: kynureninase [Candidatus Limnocylindrales bacterium]|nr:kynureninase [Candidatus Limnocylindrales bacterium]